MTQLNALEESLANATKGLPALPKGFKDFLVAAAPWLSLLGGIVALATTWSMYRAVSVVNGLAEYANSISQLYGNGDVVSNNLTAMMWVSLAFLAVMGVIYLLAFPGLKDKKKSGWDLLFLATLVNLAYCVVGMFTSYRGDGNLVVALLGTGLGWYFLFQIREYYTGAKKPVAKAAKA